METIEQLKQDNLKLQERLNNAAKFFREQKAQIEALTKENEELKSKPKEEVIDTKKWNALVTEKENLNKQLNEYELKLQKLEGDYKDLKKVYEDEQSEYENKITLLEEDNIKLSEKCNLLDEYKSDLQRAEKLINEQKEDYENKLANAQAEITTLEAQKAVQSTLQKQLDDLQEKSTVTLHEFKKLQTEYDKLTNEYNKCFEEKNKLFEENNDLTIKLNNITENSEIRNEILNKIVSLINGLNNVNNNQTKVTKNNNERIGNEYVVDNPVINI